MSKDNDLVLTCDCHALNHIVRFSSYKEDNEFYVAVMLNKNHSFLRRVKIGLNYIFGGLIKLNQQDYDYSDVCLTKEKCVELKEMLETHLKNELCDNLKDTEAVIKLYEDLEKITKHMESCLVEPSLILKINYATKIDKNKEIYDLVLMWYDGFIVNDLEYMAKYIKQIEDMTKDYSVVYAGKHGSVFKDFSPINLELLKSEKIIKSSKNIPTGSDSVTLTEFELTDEAYKNLTVKKI
jgi:hypothetical protein